MRAFRVFPSSNVVALFAEALGGGDVLDIDAARNAPAKDPASHLASIQFHSGMDYLDVAFDTTATITHSAVAAATPLGGLVVDSGTLVYNAYSHDQLLFDPGLGDLPDFMVVVDGNVVAGCRSNPLTTGAAATSRSI